MTAIDFLDIVIHAVFVSLGVLAITDYFRHKNETRRDIALMFGILAIPFTLQLIARIKEQEISEGAQIASVMALVLEPYLLLRLVRYLRSMPSYMMRLVKYSMIATIVIGILVGDRAPLITLLVSQGYLIGFNLYAMIEFARGVLQSTGIRQKRLRFAAAGSGFFALIFLASLLANAVPLPEESALLLLEALTGACVITYYIAFAPPRWLRQTWQFNELQHFLHQTSKRLMYDRRVIFEELSTAALRSIGGINAVVAGCDADGKNLKIEIAGHTPFEMDNLEAETGAIRTAWEQKKALIANVPKDIGVDANRWAGQFNTQTLFIVPIVGAFRPWGMLIVAMQYAPLFPEDDLDLLSLLAGQSAIQLDYSALIQELQATNQSLEERVSERTIDLEKANRALETQIHEFKQAQEQIAYQAYLLENVNDAVIGSDQNSIIRFWNSGAKALFGWTAEEVIGRPSRETLQSEFLNTDRAAVLKILAESGRWKGEAILKRKDGSSVVIESSSITLHDANGLISGYVSVNRDITERKRTEEEIYSLNAELEQRVIERTGQLKESEEKFSKAFLASPAAVSITSMPDGRYINVNEALANLTGYSKEELIGHTSAELGLVSSEDRNKILEAANKYGFVRNVEIQIQTKSQQTAEVLTSIEQIEIGGRPCMLSVNYDITERKRAEAEVQRLNEDLEQRQIALSEANALLQTLMDHMPDHIYFKDLSSRFIRNSKSQAVMMGADNPTEVIGRTDFDFFPKGHAQRSYNEEQNLIKSEQPILDIEEEVLWPDGHITWVSTTKMPLRDAQGQVTGTFGISRDITERKQAEKDIQKLNEDLKQRAAQLETSNQELESFSYSVSHDLRAPLRSIDGFSHAILEDYGEQLPAEARSYLDRVRNAAQRMAELIDDLLNLSRISRSTLQTSFIDLSLIVGEITDTLQKSYSEREITFSVQPGLMVEGDPRLLKIALENLLNNACKFTSKKEQTLIEFGKLEQTEEQTFYIRDNGAGFNMDYVDKLFAVFQRLHATNDYPGTGVGLAIVQRIIKIHGGRIWAEGEEGKGATFYFIL